MEGRLTLSPDTVARIVARQFPLWAHLPVSVMSDPGWDNLSFRLGREMVVRMPSHTAYVTQVEKEQTWLPRLAPHLSLPIPHPLAQGEPDLGYPFAFFILSWIEGMPGTRHWPADMNGLACELAAFVKSLQACSTQGAPAAGAQNFHRRGNLAVYDQETRDAIAALGARIDGSLCLAIWESALRLRWPHAPVWLHGDLAPDNLLFDRETLSAVIDFGTCGVGDPASDYALAFTHFDTRARDTLSPRLSIDSETLRHAQAWALWKALITLRDDPWNPDKAKMVKRVALA